MSTVETLLGECQRVADAIAGHRQAISDLTAERDGMVSELRRLGLSERAVGRLLGISGPRVNQIMNPAEGAAFVPAVVERERPQAEFEERRAEREMAEGYVAPEAPQSPPRHPRRRAAARRTVTPAPAGVPAAAFQEPTEPAPERQRQKAECKHPGVGRKQRCPHCGSYNV